MTEAEVVETVRWLSNRLRSGHGLDDLWDKHVEAVKEAWKVERLRADADVVIDAFPGRFPLIGKRAAH